MQTNQKNTLHLLKSTVQVMAVLAMMSVSFGASAKDVKKDTTPFSRKGADQCVMCHTDEHIMTVLETPHGATGDSRAPFGEGQAQCEACHGPGGKRTFRLALAPPF